MACIGFHVHKGSVLNPLHESSPELCHSEGIKRTGSSGSGLILPPSVRGLVWQTERQTDPWREEQQAGQPLAHGGPVATAASADKGRKELLLFAVAEIAPTNP